MTQAHSTRPAAAASASNDTTTTHSAQDNELACAKPPTSGGPMTTPPQPSDDTMAMPAAALTPLTREAATNSSGITLARPSPSSASPTSDHATESDNSMIAIAQADNNAVARSSRVAATRARSQSPPKRPAAIAAEKHARPIAASDGAAPRSRCRYSVLQS